jgi:hypothetical protein
MSCGNPAEAVRDLPEAMPTKGGYVREQLWGPFVTYVNAFYAVQEAYDSARRDWERPAQGLEEFCRDANPFLWDEEGSAEPALYEGFLGIFERRFPLHECSAQDGRAVAEEWLMSLEGEVYGAALVSSLNAVSDERAWQEAFEPIARQLAARATRLERSPQDVPEPEQDYEPAPPSQASIEAVIALLAKGDEAFAQSLRERLAQDGSGPDEL